jgi:polyferredoxin
MYCGFASIFKFIETIAKILPFLANIIWVWTWIIALWLTLIVWFVTIGIAWLAVRPVIGICCLVVAAGWILLLVKSKKDKKANLPKEEKIEETPEIIE